MGKKFFMNVMAFVFCAAGLQAQNTFSKGDMTANAGIGLGGTSKVGFLSSGSFDYGIVDQLFNEKSTLGIGGFLGYSVNDNKSKNSLGIEYGWKENNIIIGARGVLHYYLVDKLDTYAGVMFGCNLISFKYYGDDWGASTRATPNNSAVSTLFVGGRYYFTNHIGAFTELGLGYGLYHYVQAGLSFRF